jgi:site-specific DNA-methyltransferase (cytosine-N4-specific)
MTAIRCRIKDYIQPFERALALRELSAVAAATPLPIGNDDGDSTEFVVTTKTPKRVLVECLAYWELVSTKSTATTTLQSLRESTVNVVRNGIDLDALKQLLPFQDGVPLPNRRCLRYGTHGIHEYRGKFFPQLVRSLINISGTRPGGIIADPMSGSGTTLVEAALFGCRGLGLDMNPLSTYLGNAKCQLLSADAKKLEVAYRRVRDSVLAPEARGKQKLAYLQSLPQADQLYLGSWFGEEVLAGLDEIATIIRAVAYAPARNLMWIALSNILRSVSWQKDDDLRVRKEVRLDVEIDPKREFLEEIARSVRAVLAFLYQEQPISVPKHSIETGDARRCGELWSEHKGKVDAMITSPPYATALPYLDTDRLSLCFLRLLPRPEHRRRDQQMIGNREVTEGMRRAYLAQLQRDGALLPNAVRKLVKRIESLNDGTGAGFRRRNLPALLSNYFFDMRDVLKGMFDVLKPGGNAFVVVGNNHTIAGGTRVGIETAKLLAETAGQLGFVVQPSLSMDMLVSRDIFKKNAMATEEILFLRKPGYR